MNNPLQILRDNHGLMMSDDELQKIVNTCAQIIVIQDAKSRPSKEIHPFDREEDWDDDYDEEDDYEWAVENFDCSCGAWVHKNNTFIHVADCICGSSEPF